MSLGELGASVEPMDDDLRAHRADLVGLSQRDVERPLPRYAAAMGQPAEPDAAAADGARQGRPPAATCGRALLARTQLFRKVQGWFDGFDVIVTPTLTRTAIPIEERLFEPIEIEGRKTDTVRKAWYPYTHPFNLTGHPAITLPCGFHSDGLPMAIQLVGRRGEDARLLRIAALFEQARPWAGRRPAIEGVD